MLITLAEFYRNNDMIKKQVYKFLYAKKASIDKNIKFNFMETSLKKKSGVGKFKMQWGGDTLINFGYRYNLSLISKILGFFGK